MKKQRSDAIKTKLRLLEAAGEVFAEKGFWTATHEDICHKAEANTASINYHFGGKENLYVEAWKYSFEKSIRKHPPEGNALPGDTIEARIRGRILSILERIIDPETHDIDIIRKELSTPTGLLGEAIAGAIEPVEKDFKTILREFLGKTANDETVDLCYIGILSQCFSPMLHLRCGHEVAPMPRQSIDLRGMGVEKLAEHITRFIFFGINSFRETSN